MNPSEFLAITCNLLKVREKSLVQGASGFGFGFASHWMKNWCEIFKPISKRSSRIFTFENHLKTAPWRIISGGCLFNLQMWNDFWSEWSPHQAILVSNSSGWKEVGKKYRLDQRVESMTLWFSCTMLNQTYFDIYISKFRVSRKQHNSCGLVEQVT